MLVSPFLKLQTMEEGRKIVGVISVEFRKKRELNFDMG